MKLDVWGFVWTYKGHRGFSWDQIWDIYIYMLSVYILTYAPPSPPLPTLGLDTATSAVLRPQAAAAPPWLPGYREVPERTPAHHGHVQQCAGFVWNLSRLPRDIASSQGLDT